jgi:hypothetical protein
MLEGFCFDAFFCLFFHVVTHTQGNKKNNEGKQREKHKWKYAECDHVKKGRKKSCEAESFKHMKIKYPTHLKMVT